MEHRKQKFLRFFWGIAVALLGLAAVSAGCLNSLAKEKDGGGRIQVTGPDGFDREEVCARVEADIVRLKPLGDLAETDLCIAIKEKTDVPYVENGTLVCTAGDLESGRYRPALVQVLLGIEEPWLYYGISGYFFGDTIEESLLREWYAHGEDMGILRLFGLRFFPEWVTPKEWEIARQTAISLVRWMTEVKREDVRTTPMTDARKQEWLTWLGVDKIYTDPYAGWLDGYRFERSEDFLVQILGEDASYCIYDFVKYGESAQDIETFLYRERHGKEQIYQYLEKEGGRAAGEVFRDREKLPYVRYLIRGEDAGSNKVSKTKQITLCGCLHGHLFAWEVLAKKQHDVHWANDALLLYLDSVYVQEDYAWEHFREFWENGVLYPGRPEKFAGTDQVILEYAHAYLERNPEVSLNRSMVDAMAAAGVLENRKIGGIFGATYLERHGLSAEQAWPGDTMNRMEAASFYAWLVDSYSLEKTLSLNDIACPDYEEIFGNSYVALVKEWKAYLAVSRRKIEN